LKTPQRIVSIKKILTNVFFSQTNAERQKGEKRWHFLIGENQELLVGKKLFFCFGEGGSQENE